MSAGERGFCGQVGFRNRKGYVDVDHLCGEHEPAPAWPEDQEACGAARIEASSRSVRQDAIAFNGIDAIPQRWREGVEGAGELMVLAKRLAGDSS